jgi:hypothetical protein
MIVRAGKYVTKHMQQISSLTRGRTCESHLSEDNVPPKLHVHSSRQSHALVCNDTRVPAGR